jgi:hypothetical protein
MHTTPLFEPNDLDTLRRRGMRVEDVEQLERIRHAPEV